MEQKQIKLTDAAIKEIEEILSRKRGAEIAVKNYKVVIWETSSKKKYEETAITQR